MFNVLPSVQSIPLIVSARAVMIPGLESAPESDFGSIWTFDYDNSGSGSFSSEPLESAPVLESAPLVVLNIAGAYYIKKNYLYFLF